MKMNKKTSRVKKITRPNVIASEAWQSQRMAPLKARKSVSLLLVMILSLFLVAVPMAGIAEAQSSTEVWVDDNWAGLASGSSADGHTFGTDAFDTIQNGVDAVENGGTVYVANGTYTATSLASIVITRPLSLIGESRDGAIIDAGMWGTSNAGWPKGIHVYADDVTIKNFTVQGFTGDQIATGGYGVLFRDYAHDTSEEGFVYYDGCMVENVCSQNNCYPMYAFCYTNLTIYNCLIQNNLSDGMFIAKGSDNAVITGNTVLNSGDHGIWVGGAGWCGPSCNNATIIDNYIDGAREGGISFVASDGAIISGNTITNVAGETSPDGYSAGALSLIGDCSNVTATNNVIYNNAGTWGGYNGTGNGIGIWQGTPSNIVLNNNDIYGNNGHGCYNYTDVSVDATKNWWGDASGPHNATSNPDGTGDKVSDNVNFIPFLASSGGEVVNKVSITKSGLTSANSGDDITYTITYKNIGTNYATNVVVTETYPSEVEYVSATPAPDNGTTNKWTIGTLALNEEGTITITVHIK
jgi:uncharacterized repeat protein (TIGR01451 family)